MKRPFEFVRESFFENLDKLKENQRYNFNNSEKFMIWIVGFSISGLAIIVTNLTQFNLSFDHCTIKAILLLLSISIISGIIYRWYFYLYQIQYQNIEFYLQGSFTKNEFMTIHADDISDEDDIKEVIRRLRDDFGEDASLILDKYNIKDNGDRIKLLNELKERHKKVSDDVELEFKSAIDFAKSVYKDGFGLSDKNVDKMFKPHSPSKFKAYGTIVKIAFFMSCLSFIAVIIILCVQY